MGDVSYLRRVSGGEGMKWRLGLIVSVCIGLLGMAGVATAHANLVRSEPPSGAVLAASPEEIHLYFSEPLEAAFSQASLRDAQGTVLDTPPAEIAGADGTELVLRPGDLPDGVFTVAWRVISSADGHLTQGTIAFTIGAAEGAAAGAVAVSEPIPPDSAIVRWLNVLSLALAMGSVGFLLFVWQPALPIGEPVIERRMRRLMGVGWLALGLTSGLLLLLQVSIAANAPLLAALSSPALGPVIASTRFGQLWLARLALWLILGGVLWGARQRPRLYWLALGVGGLLVLTQSLFSHASSAPDSVASVAGDWLHLTAVSLWMGGLAQFLLVIPPFRKRFTAEALAGVVGHFSNYARIAVGTAIVTGLYAAWLLVGSVDGLLTTVYGQALLIKILLVVPLLGIAAVNLLVTQRALNNGEALWGGRLRRLVGLELTLGVAIMAAVGVMTAIAPARNVVAQREAVPVLPQPTPFFDSFYVQDSQIHVDLEITPGWVGENDFTITLYTHAGDPIPDASLIRMRFLPLDENLGESELRPEHQGEGIYTIRGTTLSLPGDWRIRVTVQRPGEFDTVVDFTPQIAAAPVPVAPAVDAAPPLDARRVWLLLGGVALLALGGVALWMGGRYRARTRLLAGPLLVVGIAFAAFGIQDARQLSAEQAAVANNPTPAARQETTLPNPIPPDAASISAGNALYAQYCVACHGSAGRGDGPVGLTLNPRPADLTVHTVAGVHTDGQLYEWIRDGFPNSAMPAFGQALSETDRWNLVNYIRTLGQTP